MEDNVNASYRADGLTVTVIVEIKYISHESLVVHTENCKNFLCLDDKVHPKECHGYRNELYFTVWLNSCLRCLL